MQRRTLLTLGASLPLAACGFKLRGSVDFAFRSIYLAGAANSDFLKELQRNLEASGSGLQVLRDPNDATKAEAIYDDLGQRRQRVIISRNASGQVRELQVRLLAKFRLRTQGGAEYIGETELMQYREISYVETYALSKASEEEMLYRNMQTDLVQQIVRRLSTVKQAKPVD
ncbi:MAG: LPS assembly lipoprotein LptE [Comamonas sp.]